MTELEQPIVIGKIKVVEAEAPATTKVALLISLKV